MRTLESGYYPLLDCDGNNFPPNSKQAARAGRPFSLDTRAHIHRWPRNYMACVNAAVLERPFPTKISNPVLCGKIRV